MFKAIHPEFTTIKEDMMSEVPPLRMCNASWASSHLNQYDYLWLEQVILWWAALKLQEEEEEVSLRYISNWTVWLQVRVGFVIRTFIQHLHVSHLHLMVAWPSQCMIACHRSWQQVPADCLEVIWHPGDSGDLQALIKIWLLEATCPWLLDA